MLLLKKYLRQLIALKQEISEKRHDIIKNIRDRIDSHWKQVARKLKTALEHHIKDEEGKVSKAAKQLFPHQEEKMMRDAFLKLKPTIRGKV